MGYRMRTPDTYIQIFRASFSHSLLSCIHDGVFSLLRSYMLGFILHLLGRDDFPIQPICYRLISVKCSLSTCKYLHIFSFYTTCALFFVLQIKDFLSPIHVSALAAELSHHKDLTEYLISSLSNGFHPDIIAMPTPIHICKKMLSTLKDPVAVNSLLATSWLAPSLHPLSLPIEFSI